MTVYYNEFDPQVAAWLRVLIAEGHIAPGVVDERSIEDVRPSDLRGFKQCHFFAGIGVWSYALRRAGWRDDRPIWTGSCPCQPFSAAGKGAGFDDERHLWPAFHWLIKECAPECVVGEQVASAAVDDWIDLVHADMEALGYAFGSVPFPAAGVGAPHIRDRNYWVAHANGEQHNGCRIVGARRRIEHPDGGAVDGLAYLQGNGRKGKSLRTVGGLPALGTSDSRELGRLADDNQYGRIAPSIAAFHHPEYHAEPCGGIGGMGNASGQGLDERERERGILGGTSGAVKGKATVGTGVHFAARPGPANGHWRDADWLGCRDGKWRPVEPGTFPLAHGASARVVRLRGYGNAINAEAARTWIETVMECLP